MYSIVSPFNLGMQNVPSFEEGMHNVFQFEEGCTIPPFEGGLGG
jgi:hypothetical protein